MIKTMILNVEGMSTEKDFEKITDHFQYQPGIEQIQINPNMNLVTIKYHDDHISHTKRFIDDLNEMGYLVK